MPATPSSLNRLRYVKNKSLGMTAEEIAESEGVKISTVKKSISDVEAYHGLFTIKEMEAGQNEVIMLNQNLEALALQRGLMAETIIRDEDGKEIDREPNYEIQQRSVETIVKLVEAVKSQKGGSGSQRMNLNLGVVTGGNTQATVGAQSFEDRLRVIQKNRGEITAAASSSNSGTVDSDVVTEVRPNWTDEDKEAENNSAEEGDGE